MPRTEPAATSWPRCRPCAPESAPPSRWPPSWTGESRSWSTSWPPSLFVFNRKFLFRALSMGHSQFAELIGARGPNTQVNSACASTTLASPLAEDWIRAGRCPGVIVVAADDVTNDAPLRGSAPASWQRGRCDRRRGRGRSDPLRPSPARHDRGDGRGGHRRRIGRGGPGTRHPADLRGAGRHDRQQRVPRHTSGRLHVSQVMEQVISQAESRGIDRQAMAAATMFVSHETYTPARGGSAAAEIYALRGPPSARRPTRSSSPTRRASPATPWALASRTSSRSRGWRPGSSRQYPTSRNPIPTSAS